MTIPKKQCGDCKLELPLKQFASYRGVRHPLCRTCLAIDVADFKDWVLPFVEERRASLEPPWHWEDWEFAVRARLELSGNERATMLRRRRNNCQPSRAGHRTVAPEILRPWKYGLAA